MRKVRLDQAKITLCTMMIDAEHSTPIELGTFDPLCEHLTVHIAFVFSDICCSACKAKGVAQMNVHVNIA